MTVQQLRIKYPVFEYQKSAWQTFGNDLHLEWKIQCGELKFNPKVIIYGGNKNINKKELDNLVFNLGMADIFSYWKATCSPIIKISAGFLSEDQISFWHDLLISGMGQYFYENKIDFKQKDFIKIICHPELVSGSVKLLEEKQFDSDKMLKQVQHDNGSILIPVGGGKDSAVTLELFKKNIGAFTINLARSDKMLPSAKRLMDLAGIKEQIFVQRILDPQLFNLKRLGFLDGHIPFTAYLSFLSILVAKLFGYSEIVFSNEWSANEGNLEYLGTQINHQYSKSIDFENKFRSYNLSYLSNLRYLSFLRPLYELQIMKIFSTMPQYFAAFRSCNRNYNLDSWCGKCPKCLATYVSLYPFVNSKVLSNIFGHDLFSDKDLLPVAKDVLGEGKRKPFECVGTFKETIVAFYLCLKKTTARPVLLEFFEKEILPEYPNIEQIKTDILDGWDNSNNLPEIYKTILHDALSNS